MDKFNIKDDADEGRQNSQKKIEKENLLNPII